MRRRDFITGFVGAVAMPFVARAKQIAPVVGFLYSASAEPHSDRTEAFRGGLSEQGFVAGKNLAVEYRLAEGHYERLAEMAAELVRRPVSVIAASGVTAARAAKAATSTIPIVFNTGGDPVRLGLVSNMARPEGNLTGVATLGKTLIGKQMELLHELLPANATFVFLINPNNAAAREEAEDASAAAEMLGRKLHIDNAGTEHEIEAAYRAAKKNAAGAVLLQADPYFSSIRDRLLALSMLYSVPTVSPFLDFAGAGGLFSYGSSIPDALRLVGHYVGRILKGAKPADLPVQQAVKVELVVNVRTAKALGLALPTSVLLRANEVIE